MNLATQTIFLDGNDNEKSYGIHSSFVNIAASPTSSINAISKISSSSLMVSPLVSYDWEYRYYSTRLLTSHLPSGNTAWFIKGKPNKALVRVTYGETRVRSLLTNFDTDFLTLEFSPYHVPILAVLSFDGVLKIFYTNHIDAVNNLLISINLNEGNTTLTHCSLKWGPKLDVPKKHEDTSLLLAVALNNKAYVIDLNGIAEQLPSDPIDLESASVYYQSYPRLLGKMVVRLPNLDSNIEAMAFSSDASAFFVGENVGKLFMFKLSDIRLESLSHCHEWLTPGSSPLSTLHYVDYKDTAASEGYLIGGTDFNRKLYLWRLPDYSLVQTISFCPSKEQEQENDEALKRSIQPMLIAHFDPKTNLLLASDIKRTVLYVLHLSRDPVAPEEVKFQCVSEFLLVSPCISFDVSCVSRSLSLDRPFSAYNPEDSDNIEVRLTLIFSRELTAGKLNFSVPLSIYMTRDPRVEEHQHISEAVPEKDLFSTLGTADICSSPVVPEGDKNSAFGNPFSMLTKIFSRRPTSASALPYTQPLAHDAPSVPPPTEKSPSMGSNTPQAGSVHEITPLGKCWDGGNLCPGDISLTPTKPSDFTPENMESGVAGVFPRKAAFSPHASEGSLTLGESTGHRSTDKVSRVFSSVYPNHQPFWGLEGMGKTRELSDSVRSLAGSSSVASLSNLISHDPSVMDFSRPIIDAFTVTPGVIANLPPTDSGPSLNESVTDIKVTETIPDSSVTPPSDQEASEDMDIRQMLKSLLMETRAQATATKALTKKIQENKTQLTKLASVQATILKQVSTLTLPSPLASVPPTTNPTASPIWATQLKDQLNKQTVETTKRLTQLETSMKQLNASVISKNTPAKSSVLDTKLLQSLQSQIHNVIRSELQNAFQLNVSSILDPLRHHLRVSLGEMLDPLPKTVADRMLAVVVDPKFSQYFSSQISTAITPSIAGAYREELRREFVPALTKGVDKLTKEMDELVKGALNQHMQSTILRIDSGVQSSRDKIDVSTRKFVEQYNQLSNDIAVKVAAQINELLYTVIKEKCLSSLPVSNISTTATTVGEASSAAIPKEAPMKGPKSTTNDNSDVKKKNIATLPQGGSIVNPYQIALGYIQNHQYADALETALTSNNQAVLLKVLQNVPVVQLFRQSVKQEILLSLIHQLSCGYLKEQLEMKISFLQEAVNHLRLNDDTVKELGDNILSTLVSKMSTLRSSGTLTTAEENRALVLLKTVQEKWQNRSVV